MIWPTLRAPSESAAHYHRIMARSIVAAALIPRGAVLTADMLAFKRTDARLPAGMALAYDGLVLS